MKGSRNRFGRTGGYAQQQNVSLRDLLNRKSKNKIDGMRLKQVYESDGTKTWSWMISTDRSQDKIGSCESSTQLLI